MIPKRLSSSAWATSISCRGCRGCRGCCPSAKALGKPASRPAQPCAPPRPSAPPAATKPFVSSYIRYFITHHYYVYDCVSVYLFEMPGRTSPASTWPAASARPWASPAPQACRSAERCEPGSACLRSAGRKAPGLSLLVLSPTSAEMLPGTWYYNTISCTISDEGLREELNDICVELTIPRISVAPSKRAPAAPGRSCPRGRCGAARRRTPCGAGPGRCCRLQKCASKGIRRQGLVLKRRNSSQKEPITLSSHALTYVARSPANSDVRRPVRVPRALCFALLVVLLLSALLILSISMITSVIITIIIHTCYYYQGQDVPGLYSQVQAAVLVELDLHQLLSVCLYDVI